MTLPAAAERSDAELITAVRGGDTAAFGQLWQRHLHAANNLARQLARSGAEADDLVSDAFAKVLDTLRNGGGPDTAFRAYLLTSLRNTFYDKVRRDKRLQLSDDMTDHDAGVPFVDTAVEGLEASLAARAFASLPERWQTVLWHTEIEGDSPAQVAPVLGMTPNGVSALAYRAREGLRQAYLQMHLADTADAQCRDTVERLGAWARQGLSKREQAQVDSHLDECDRCRALAAELVDVNHGLRGIIAPLVIGAPWVAGYLGLAGSSAKGALLIGGAGVGGGAGAAEAGKVGWLWWLRSAGNGVKVAAGAGAGVVVAAMAVALALTLGGGEKQPLANEPPGIAAPQPGPNNPGPNNPGPNNPAPNNPEPNNPAPNPPPDNPDNPGGGAGGAQPNQQPPVVPPVQTTEPAPQPTTPPTTQPGTPPQTTAPIEPTTPTTTTPTTTTPTTTAPTTPPTTAPTTSPTTQPTTPSTSPSSEPPPPPTADLTTSADSVGSLVAGRPGVVAMKTANDGPDDSGPTTAKVDLPPDVTYDGVDGDGWTAQPEKVVGFAPMEDSGSTITLRGPALAAGESTTAYLHLSVGPSAKGSVRITVTSEATDDSGATAETAPVQQSGLAAQVAMTEQARIESTGNTFLTSLRPWMRHQPVDNNTAVLVPCDLDDSKVTVQSSAATVDADAGEVLWAGLYWSASNWVVPDPAADEVPAPAEEIWLSNDGVNYTTVSAQRVEHLGGLTQSFADVTDQVKAADGGTWWAGLDAAHMAAAVDDAYAGWSLVVVVKDDWLPERQVAVFDGLAGIDSKDPQTYSVATTPGPAEIGTVVWEGDPRKTGDAVTLDGAQLDSDEPENMQRSQADGAIGDPPDDYWNTFGVDVHRYDIDLDTRAKHTIQAVTGADVYYLGVVTMATQP